MPFGIEQSLINQTLIWLAGRGRRSFRESKGDNLDVFREIAVNFPIYNDGELEQVFSTKHLKIDLQDYKKFIILEPVPKESAAVPVLSFMYNFERDRREVRFRIGLFFLNKKAKTIEAIGFRFESPEDSIGNHSFYHAQLMLEYYNSKWLPPSGRVLPLHQPSIALDAVSPVELLICMLISLYGKNFLREIQTAVFWDQLKPKLRLICMTP